VSQKIMRLNSPPAAPRARPKHSAGLPGTMEMAAQDGFRQAFDQT